MMVAVIFYMQICIVSVLKALSFFILALVVHWEVGRNRKKYGGRIIKCFQEVGFVCCLNATELLAIERHIDGETYAL